LLRVLYDICFSNILSHNVHCLVNKYSQWTMCVCVTQERSLQLKLFRSNCPRDIGIRWTSTQTTHTFRTSTRVMCYISHESISGMERRNQNLSVSVTSTADLFSSCVGRPLLLYFYQNDF